LGQLPLQRLNAASHTVGRGFADDDAVAARQQDALGEIRPLGPGAAQVVGVGLGLRGFLEIDGIQFVIDPADVVAQLAQ
jgi:hypothetical protein